MPHANLKLIKGGKSRVMRVSGKPDEIVSIDPIDFEPIEQPPPLRVSSRVHEVPRDA
jgi:hypothetical protein